MGLFKCVCRTSEGDECSICGRVCDSCHRATASLKLLEILKFRLTDRDIIEAWQIYAHISELGGYDEEGIRRLQKSVTAWRDVEVLSEEVVRHRMRELKAKLVKKTGIDPSWPYAEDIYEFVTSTKFVFYLINRQAMPSLGVAEEFVREEGGYLLEKLDARTLAQLVLVNLERVLISMTADAERSLHKSVISALASKLLDPQSSDDFLDSQIEWLNKLYQLARIKQLDKKRAFMTSAPITYGSLSEAERDEVVQKLRTAYRYLKRAGDLYTRSRDIRDTLRKREMRREAARLLLTAEEIVDALEEEATLEELLAKNYEEVAREVAKTIKTEIATLRRELSSYVEELVERMAKGGHVPDSGTPYPEIDDAGGGQITLDNFIEESMPQKEF